jgi:hypothetical protein
MQAALLRGQAAWGCTVCRAVLGCTVCRAALMVPLPALSLRLVRHALYSAYISVCTYTACIQQLDTCVSSYCYVCVLILLRMCPHTACCFALVRAYILIVHIYDSAYIRKVDICVLMLLCMSSYCSICVLILRDAAHSSVIDTATYCYMCVRILLYMCPHPAIYVSSSTAHSSVAPIVPRRIRMLTYADV